MSLRPKVFAINERPAVNVAHEQALVQCRRCGPELSALQLEHESILEPGKSALPARVGITW